MSRTQQIEGVFVQGKVPYYDTSKPVGNKEQALNRTEFNDFPNYQIF